MQVPTVRNINLKYGSLAAFFAQMDADIVCLQVCPVRPVLSEGVQWRCCSVLLNVSGMQRLAQGCTQQVGEKHQAPWRIVAVFQVAWHHQAPWAERCGFMLLLFFAPGW